MFHHHCHKHNDTRFEQFREHLREHGFRGGPRGPMGWGGGPEARGFGGGRERVFDSGELKLVILNHLAEKPSYGYEIIKAIEEKLSGGYAPSPGVVYPTLTLLEEEGLTTPSTSDAGKKVYTVTQAGADYLKENQRRLQEVIDRLTQTGEAFSRGRSPQIMRAFMNLRGAVKAKVSRHTLTAEQLKKIADAIDAAARTIDEV